MFYKIRQIDYDEEVEWCVIELDSQILAEKECIFCIENAASNNERYRISSTKKGVEGLKKLFYNDDKIRQDIHLPSNFTTNPQAEVLVLEDIQVDYIKSVSFENCIPYNFQRKYSNIEFCIDKDLFKYRFDYSYWR